MFSKNEKIALLKGVMVKKDGTAFGSRGGVVKYRNAAGYYSFHIRVGVKTILVAVHRVQAYLKFGEDIYNEGMVVRHLDGNQLNNSWSNIAIGTNSDNRMDIPKDMRVRSAKIASMNNGISYPQWKIDAIKKDLSLGISYSKIMEKYNISSKGTVSYIKNKYMY